MQKCSMALKIKRWKQVSAKTLGKNAYFDYVLETYVLPNGKRVEYYAVRKPHAANMVGVLDDGRVILVKQYRALFNKISLEIPGGGGGERERPKTIARREFEEETGYHPGAVREIGTWATDNSLMDEVIHTFLLTKLKKGKKMHDAVEETELVLMTPDEVDRAIADGTIWHGQSIVSWHLAKPYLI